MSNTIVSKLVSETAGQSRYSPNEFQLYTTAVWEQPIFLRDPWVTHSGGRPVTEAVGLDPSPRALPQCNHGPVTLRAGV